MTPKRVRHADVSYAVVQLDSCLELALELRRGGKTWHSHVLSPGCIHNPYPGSYSIVIENDSDGLAHIAPSEGFPDIDKDLVRILHGDDILDASKAVGGKDEASISSEILRRVFDLDAKGIAWHHHMHFPSCALSPHKGKWCIGIESSTGIFSESFDAEPVSILREIEVVYFRNLAAP
jgi:hypothetical protein